MSRSKFDRLIDQFYEREGNLRAQQVILRQIAGMRDPQAIPELLAIYKRKDAPVSLRQIAGQGLRDFWLLNQRVSEGSNTPRSVTIEPWLRRARPVLAGILAITLVINVALLIARAIPAPAQTTPSTVASIGSLYKQQISDARAAGNNLRLRWQEVQSQIKVNCGALPIIASPITPVPVDLTTYAGIMPLNADLNDVLSQLGSLREPLAAMCATSGTATVSVPVSGAAGQIVLVDTALTKLDTAQGDLDRWLAAPLPSATPSPLPPTHTATALPSATGLPTATRPPPTAGPSPTLTWTPLPPSATPIPVSSTPSPIPTATGVTSTQISSLGLSTLTSYSYVLTIVASGKRTGQPISGSLTVNALRPSAALTDASQAEYQIGLSPDLLWMQPLDLLYQSGQVKHILLNHSYYFDTIQPPGIACQVVPGSNRAAPLQAIDPNTFLKPVFGITLTRMGNDESISGITAHRYHADKSSGVDPGAVTVSYDVYISADSRQIPLRVEYSVNGAVSNALIGLPGITIPNTDQLTSYTASFTFQQINPTLAIQPPAECR